MLKTVQRRSAILVAVAVSTVTLTAGSAIAAVPVAHVSPAAAAVGGGRTTVTTGPGIANTLVSHGIQPIVTRPGREGLRTLGGLAVTGSFPVTGGSASLSPLGGEVLHKGVSDSLTCVTASR